jgi:hypothetical protein
MRACRNPVFIPEFWRAMQRACDLASQARCALWQAHRTAAREALLSSNCCLAFIRWPHTDLHQTTMAAELLAHQQPTRSLLPIQHARQWLFLSNSLIHKEK